MDSLLASWTSLTSIWKFNHIHTSLTSTFHFIYLFIYLFLNFILFLNFT